VNGPLGVAHPAPRPAQDRNAGNILCPVIARSAPQARDVAIPDSSGAYSKIPRERSPREGVPSLGTLGSRRSGPWGPVARDAVRQREAKLPCLTAPGPGLPRSSCRDRPHPAQDRPFSPYFAMARSVPTPTLTWGGARRWRVRRAAVNTGRGLRSVPGVDRRPNLKYSSAAFGVCPELPNPETSQVELSLGFSNPNRRVECRRSCNWFVRAAGK